MRGSRFERAAAARTRRSPSPLRSFAVAVPLLIAVSGSAHAVNPVVFSIFGDVPYSTSELVDLQGNVSNHNLYSPSAFLVHLGDIQSGTEACQEVRYQQVADTLKTSEVPVFIVPGDNEWVDCANPAQGWAWWQTYLLGLEQSFCGIWPVEAQVARPENFSFLRDGVLFLGLNYVAGTPSSVVQADADWVNAQFAAHGAAARAAVLLAQKEPGGALFDAVVANGRAFGKPVLYAHGDGHAWLVDSSFFGEPNMLRVQVDRGTLAHPPVEVTVSVDGQFLFDRNPWPPGTPQIVRPICSDQPSLSIDDLFAAEGQDAVFTLSLAGATGSAVSVGYATQDGTALAGQDYVAKSGTLSFSGATTQQQIRVPVSQDAIPEPGEAFVVNLSNASGAAIGRGQGTAVILDDDSGPTSTTGPVLREAVTGGSENSSVVTTAGPLGGQSGDLYLAAVASKSYVGVSSVSGLGLTWTPVRQQCAGRSQTGVALFRAQGSPIAGGTVSANLSGVPGAAVISVARYAGASSSGGIGSVRSVNTNGVSGACAGGSDGAGYAFDLTTSAANSLVFVAAAMRNRDHLPGAGFSEVAETFAGTSGSAAGESLAERLLGAAATVNVNGSFSATVDWAVVAAEVLSGGAPSILSVTSSAGGSVTLNPPGGSYAPGSSVTLSAVPAAGFVFSGWSGALTGSANPATLVMDANKSVTATFASAPGFTVTVQPTTGGSVTLNPPGGVYASGTSVSVTATPSAGFAFAGWGGALSGTANPATLLVNANQTISASFVAQFQLSVSTTGTGSLSLSPAGGLYAPGTLVTLTAVPGAGASFLGWGGSLAGTQNPASLLMDANKSVSASFTTVYTLSVASSAKGSVVLDPAGGVYAAGTLVTLRAVPIAGYEFKSWSGDLSGTLNPATLVMDRSKSVTPSFRRLRR